MALVIGACCPGAWLCPLCWNTAIICMVHLLDTGIIYETACPGRAFCVVSCCLCKCGCMVHRHEVVWAREVASTRALLATVEYIVRPVVGTARFSGISLLRCCGPCVGPYWLRFRVLLSDCWAVRVQSCAKSAGNVSRYGDKVTSTRARKQALVA